MIYPFAFNELLLTPDLVRYLGFDNWWGDSGDGWEIAYGTEEGPGPVRYRLRATSEEAEPYTYNTVYYQTAHFMSYKFDTLYFFHELYEDIMKNANAEDAAFLVARFNTLTVRPYLQAYLAYKRKQTALNTPIH